MIDDPAPNLPGLQRRANFIFVNTAISVLLLVGSLMLLSLTVCTMRYALSDNPPQPVVQPPACSPDRLPQLEAAVTQCMAQPSHRHSRCIASVQTAICAQPKTPQPPTALGARLQQDERK